MKLITVEKIPTWAMCYLEYGDPTGLEEEDIFQADGFINENFPRGYVMELQVDGDCVSPYYTSHPAFGLGCEVYDVAFYEP